MGIRGRILDERYTRLLMMQTDLDLGMIMLLDKVQKRQAISANDSKRLRTAKLVEGRYPNLVVAAMVATATGEKAKHIRDRGFNSQYYRDLIVELIRKHQPVSREDIDRLLLDKLPEVLSEAQKRNRIHNLLRQLATAGQIQNNGSRRFPRWVLSGDGNNQ